MNDPRSSSFVQMGNDFMTLKRTTLTFGTSAGGHDDRLLLRATVPMPISDVDAAAESVTLTIAHDDGPVYSATIPPLEPRAAPPVIAASVS